MTFSISGGVKEEQVLDAFKILFNDNQVNRFEILHYLEKENLGQSCTCQYIWWYC
jgi:hypothetical protein